MLNNFIYAQTKDLFLEALGAGNILDEAIVFIEDTKEIWNHGHYFGGDSGSGVDSEIISELQTAISQLEADKLDTSTAESTYAKKSELPNLSGYLTQTTADTLYATVSSFNGLQEEIDDLTTIVSQKANSSDLDNYAIKDEVTEAVTTLNGSIATKQNTLVSGTNIKTINGESILGPGDIILDAADEVYIGSTPPTDENVTVWIDLDASVGDVEWDGIVVDEELSPNSTNPIQNKTVYALAARLDGIEAILDNING